MSDFYQHGTIATLHRLADPDMRKLEQELVSTAQERPVALVLPSLYSELEGEALKLIVGELAQVPYLAEIIISMNRMTAEQFKLAKEFFKALPQKYRIIWNDGPRMNKLYDRLKKEKLTAYQPGKGYNVWMAYGLVLTDERIRVVATHDCDILSYHRDMLTRIVMPTAHQNLTYEYCKSYYTRVSDRMFGRVTRLFVFPLLRAMIKVAGPHPLLEFLNEFRYPLSGEFSISTDLARAIRVPGDWGLEIGLLCEVYRNATVRRICQVDIGSNFEHKHQALGTVSRGGVSDGLLKMVADIARSLFRNLCSEGVQMTPAFMQSLGMTYERLAKENIGRYADDAFINGLIFVRHEESTAVEAFSEALRTAQRDFMEVVGSSPYIPNWNRINSALPDFGAQLFEAVELDNK
jgi:glucosyl-3-phosphoglycerate synthase